MPRRPRRDRPGRLHHVINRGQDRQRIFRSRADYRYFLALLVRAGRAGRIVLHTYCLMANHYHLLVESADGRLSDTMQWVQFRYAAYFNRKYKHAGHVFGGRFRSIPVTSRVYLFILIRYIDRNPWNVKRDRVDPLRYLWCSAYHHARPGPRPRWLERRIVDRFLRRRLERGEERAEAYRKVFRIAKEDPVGDALVTTRMAGRSRRPDDLDTLVLADTAQIARWWRRRTAEPEPSPPLALVDMRSVLAVIEETAAVAPPFHLHDGRGRGRDPRALVAAGLLRDLVGVTYEVAADALGSAPSHVRTRYLRHLDAVLTDDRYVQLLAETTERVLRRAFGEDLREVARDESLPSEGGEDEDEDEREA